MRSRLRGFLGNTPVKLIAVVLFAVLIPSVLVTALGLVAVFQADSFVRDRLTQPLRERVEKLGGRLREEWARRLGTYAECLAGATRRPSRAGDLRGRDPCIREVLISGPDGLSIAPPADPVETWAPGVDEELSKLRRLEVIERNDRAALEEARRILAASTEDAVLVEALLSAARLEAKLGNREESERHLRAALERYGDTADSSGVARGIPILSRLAEIQKEAGGGTRFRETLRALRAALDLRGGRMDPEAAEFYKAKLALLTEPAPVAGDALVLPAAAEEPAPRPVIAAEDLPAVEEVLRRKGGSAPAAPWREAHVHIPGSGDLDFATFEGEGGYAVHVLLDREMFLADARLFAKEAGLESEGLLFSPLGRGARAGAESERGAGVSRAIIERLSVALPSPLESLEMTYLPPRGTLPEGFRGFNVISLAAFTWAVIVLVLAIVAGIYVTVRSVLREMRTARIKSDFVSFISHELKTPLTSIRMFTETMLANRIESEEESRFCIQMIDRESERLSKLIEQVLEYSKIEKHQKEFKFTSCDMEDVVRDAVKIFQDHNRVEPREIEINAVQRISKIKMDKAAMIELFLNLLSNAAKYSPRGKKIVLNLRESIDDISVDVIDSGVGIRKRDQKKIFEKFFRAEDYLTRDVEGTGLGLTFARYIAKVHNGDIKVSSQLQSGSTFTLQLRKSHVLAE